MKILIYILRGGATFFKAEEKNKIICDIIADERLTPDIIKSDSFNNKIKKYINENKYKTDMNISLKKMVIDFYNDISSFDNELKLKTEEKQVKNAIFYYIHTKLQNYIQNVLSVTIKNIQLNNVDNHKKNLSNIEEICLENIHNYDSIFRFCLFCHFFQYINDENVENYKLKTECFFNGSYFLFKLYMIHIQKKLEIRYYDSLYNSLYN